MKAAAIVGVLFASLLSVLPAAAADGIGRSSLAGGYAQRLADLINQYRQQHGLGPLTLTEDLASIATEHTAQMAGEHRLSHDGFTHRFDRTNARMCVENVGWNYPVAEAQLDGWRASPGHHRNLLEPKVSRMGIAVSRSYVTFFACS
jgi:uncharacterized protein YkwD